MSRLTYDIVIATRNRADALALSLPLLVSQSRPPARIIIVDSSEKHADVQRVVNEVRSGTTVDITLDQVAPGLTYQRNFGLTRVVAPIVMFFDDDSLLYPDTAAQIMAVYERDHDFTISAVAGAEEVMPPKEVPLGSAWAVTRRHRTEARLRRFRHLVEMRVAAVKPALLLGKVLNARHALPDWLPDHDVVPVEYMTGFRMTFRTDAIKDIGFDEALTSYAVDEDIDASFSAMRSGLVVAARKARVYHHRHPGGRADDFALARMQVYNRAHVLLKHASGPIGGSELEAQVWRQHRLFVLLKFMSCALRAHTSAGRKRLAGMWQGHRDACRLRHAAQTMTAFTRRPPLQSSTIASVD